MPPWPIAMPSSTAIVWNSRGTPPAARTASATMSPTFLRWTCPGTNCVYELAIATIGFPKSESVIPVARHSARAPAAFRPAVVVRDLSGGMSVFLSQRTEVLTNATRALFPVCVRPVLHRLLAVRFRVGVVGCFVRRGGCRVGVGDAAAARLGDIGKPVERDDGKGHLAPVGQG